MLIAVVVVSLFGLMVGLFVLEVAEEWKKRLGKTRRKRPAYRRRLVFETLEDRRMLSVTVGVTPGADVYEYGGSGYFSFYRDNTEGELNVQYVLDSPATLGATYGADYSAPAQTGTVHFPDGWSSAELMINPIDDTLVEGDEAILLTISTSSAYEFSSPGQAIIKIIDDDFPPPPNNPPTANNDSAQTDENTPVAISVLDNDGDPDYDTLTVTSVTAPVNGGTADINVDNTITYTPPPGFSGQDNFSYTIEDGNGGSATATVDVTVNATSYPPPTVSIGDATVNEWDGTAYFTVTINGTVTDPVTVDFTTADDSAVAIGSPGDYQSASGQLTFYAGMYEQYIPVTIIDDAFVESTEQFKVYLTSANGATIDDSEGLGTIIDNDQWPALWIDDVTVSESQNTATFTVSVSGPIGSPITVDFTTANGSAIAVAGTDPGDYIAASGTLTFYVTGDTSRSFNVTIINDEIDESDKHFYVNLSNPINATIADGQGVGTIMDDDYANPTLPELTISASDSSAAEAGLDPGQFTVSLTDGALTVDLEFQYTISGTATNGEDYTITGAAIIYANQSFAELDVTPIEDEIVEGDETVVVTLTPAAGLYTVGAAALATVTIADDDEDGPTVDIDTDSDNTGAIERSALEEADEMKAPGKAVLLNWLDDNGNGVADKFDEGPFVDSNGLPMNDIDLEPVIISFDDAGEDLSDYKLELTFSGPIKLWKTLDKQALTLSYVIGTDAVPDQFFVEGVDLGVGQVNWTLKDAANGVVHSDSVKLTVYRVGMIAYRPQGEGGGYGNPFPKTEVSAGQEDDPGVGIRRNGDDDDGDDVRDFELTDVNIANENDLIEVDVLMKSLAGFHYVLTTSNNNIRVWQGSDKSGLMLLGEAGSTGLILSDPAEQGEIWVEWISMDPAETQSILRLEIRDITHDTVVRYDELKFYPFKSVVIVFGGNTQDPADEDGDGSIGDPVGNGGNREGIFDLAQQLYNEGWDVHAYDEEDADIPHPFGGPYDESPVFREVVSAVDERGVTEVAILGYSHGGGATQELAEALNDHGYNVDFVLMLDAVDHNGMNQENDYPNGTDYVLNIYQSKSLILDGGPIDTDDMGPIDQLEEIHVTEDNGWNHDLNHSSIDDDAAVQALIRVRLERELDRYEGEGEE